MKVLLFASLVIFTSFSRAKASDAEVAEDYCNPDYYECTPYQRDLVKDFLKLGTKPAVTGSEVLYQGSCYMVSAMYAPDHAHHGYIYLRQQSNGVGFYGQFSFFEPENPYSKMTLEQARQEYPDDSKYILEERAREWFIDIDSQRMWRYFIRQVAPGKWILIGHWGLNDSLICEMTPPQQ